MKGLAARGVRWIVPLGVGAHLRAWGVPEALVTELDWWDAVTVGGLTVTATPARHFSGRGLDDRDRTLWAGWAIAGPAHRVFYSGDTALHDEFDDIGRRLGPFDLTMIESGAYSALWADVHLGPEQAVLAHQLVRGDVMLPVHWGLFDLALHGWTEPVERVLAAAQRGGRARGLAATRRHAGARGARRPWSAGGPRCRGRRRARHRCGRPACAAQRRVRRAVRPHVVRARSGVSPSRGVRADWCRSRPSRSAPTPPGARRAGGR